MKIRCSKTCISAKFFLFLLMFVTARECPPDHRMCGGVGRCIPISWWCDHDQDCSGGEDEDDSCCKSISEFAIIFSFYLSTNNLVSICNFKKQVI